MAHTNSTPNYNLPQFLPTDKPAWLVDVNPAYASIDTAIKNASDAAGSAQTDATQALSDAAGAQATATQANSKADGAIASISEQFLDTATYEVGEYVIFNNILYVCTDPVTTPGPWTGSVNWTRASLDSIATALNASVRDLTARTGSDIATSDTNNTPISDMLANEYLNASLQLPTGVTITLGSINKVGNIVNLCAVLRITANIANEGTLISGLPVNAYNIRVPKFHGSTEYTPSEMSGGLYIPTNSGELRQFGAITATSSSPHYIFLNFSYTVD